MSRRAGYTVPHRVVFIDQQLDTAGDGTGNDNITADYSGTPQDFFIQQTGPYPFVISRVIIYLEDGGSFDTSGFANLGSPLPNGLQLLWTDANDVPIKDVSGNFQRNGDYARAAYDADVKTWGSGPQILVARLSFNRFTPDGLVLENGEKLKITAQDNFSGIIEHKYRVQGYIDREVPF